MVAHYAVVEFTEKCTGRGTGALEVNDWCEFNDTYVHSIIA